MLANRRVRLHEMYTLDDVPEIEDDRSAPGGRAEGE
jgi:hypothetical protein